MDALRDGVMLGVALRDAKGGTRNVRRVNRRAGQFPGKRDGDAAGASPDIGDLQALAGERLFAAGAALADREAVEGDFDDVLGFGARNQDIGRDFELKSPKFLLAGEVLRRFASRAAGNECEDAIGVHAGDLLFGMGVEPGTVAAQGMKQQEFCGERERGHLGLAKLGKPLPQRGANIHLFFAATHCGTRLERTERISLEGLPTRSGRAPTDRGGRRKNSRNKKESCIACQFTERRNIMRWRAPAGGAPIHSARTGEYVVLTDCAPGAEEQKVSTRRSFASILMSISSASGRTATVAAEV